MNITLFVLRENLQEIQAFAKKVIGFKIKTEWARCIIVTDASVEKEATEMGQKLSKVFGEVRLHSHVVGSKPAPRKFLGLMANYMTQIYLKYPGETLIHDGTGIPKDAKWIDTLRNLHRGSGLNFTGCFDMMEGGAVPKGPIIFDAPAKAVKIFRFAVDPDWRKRGRWVFSRSCNNIAEKDFPFDIVKVEAFEPEPPQEAGTNEATESADAVA